MKQQQYEADRSIIRTESSYMVWKLGSGLQRPSHIYGWRCCTIPYLAKAGASWGRKSHLDGSSSAPNAPHLTPVDLSMHHAWIDIGFPLLLTRPRWKETGDGQRFGLLTFVDAPILNWSGLCFLVFRYWVVYWGTSTASLSDRPLEKTVC